MSSSYNSNKAPRSWYAKELLILAVYVPLLLSMLGYAGLFFRGSERDSLLQLQLPMPLSLLSSPVSVSVSSRWTRAVAAVLAGALLQSFSFCTLHDASHYGLLFKVLRATLTCFAFVWASVVHPIRLPRRTDK